MFTRPCYRSSSENFPQSNRRSTASNQNSANVAKLQHRPKSSFSRRYILKVFRARTMFSHCFVFVSCVLFSLSLSSSVIASVPQTFRHANLLRTIDLTKPYIRDSTALILENIGNSPQTEYFWGVPLELAPKLSYLEVREKKTGSTDLFPIERALEDHAYPPS
jgi:hypothetical protein